MTTPNLTGVHHKMDGKEYRMAPAVSASDAKHILPPRTPAHYAAHMAGETKKEPSRAMVIGTLCHLAVLEPNKLDAAFVEKPQGMDFRTKEGKEWKAGVGDKPVLDEDETRAVRGIRDSIAAHEAARDLLDGTQSEVSMFAEHRSGLWIKGRLDAYRDGVIADVKTTSVGADAASFARQCFNMNYHVSAAWYLSLCRLNGLPPARFYWIAVETGAPFAVAVYEIDPRALELGLKMMSDALELIAQCEDEGYWPGYGNGVETLNLPPWAFGKEAANV
jgi:exodeoxyribonuclease VIII